MSMKTNENGNYGRTWVVKPAAKLMIAQGINDLQKAGCLSVNNFLSRYKFISTSTFNYADNKVLAELSQLIFQGDSFRQVDEAAEKAYPEVFDLYNQLVNAKMKHLSKC